MDIMDKVNEITKKVGDTAGNVLEIGRLTVKINSENSEVTELKKEIGEICFGKYRSGDELDPEIEKACAAIEKHKKNIAENQRKINQLKSTVSEPIHSSPTGFCPYCGTELIKDANFCPKCGKHCG